MSEKLSRRDFLKLAGAAGVGLGLGFLLGRKSNLLDSDESTRVIVQPTDKPMAVITPDAQAFDNFLPIETDSFGGNSFVEFIGNPDRLIDAWTVEGSIYSRWFKTETLASIQYAPRTFLPRWSERETISLVRLDTPQIIREYGRDSTAFILNSGGAHSLAMAYELAKYGGWQPVPMLRGIPCKFENCATSGADQDVAVALYPATEMLGITKRLPQNAPPAFIWDAHRDSLAMGNTVDNGYTFQPTDMPDASFLQNNGIGNVIYVTEANAPTPKLWVDEGYHNIDSFKILALYQQRGLNVLYLGISPNK